MKFSPLLLVLALAACNRTADTKEAIRQGVIDSIQSRVRVASMEVDVLSVDFKGDTAEANVDFRAKGAAPGSGVQMRYTLEKKSGKWVVKEKSESGGNPHGAGGDPGGGAAPHAPGGAAPPPSGALPPGHPPLPQSGQRK